MRKLIAVADGKHFEMLRDCGGRWVAFSRDEDSPRLMLLYLRLNRDFPEKTKLVASSGHLQCFSQAFSGSGNNRGASENIL